MKTLMWLLPLLLVVGLLAWRCYKSYKKGLMAVLLELGVDVVSALLAFVLTRILVNPENLDIFGLGEKLLTYVPQEFLQTSPRYEALIRAIPTAVAALIAFSLGFAFLRWLLGLIVFKLDKKWGWDQKYLQFKGQKYVAMGVGLLTALFMLVMHLVPVGGLSVAVSSSVQLVETVVDIQEYAAVLDAVHGLAESPAIRMVDSLGSRKMFCELTKARRNGEAFSAGEEMLHLADAFTKALPALRSVSTEELRRDPESLRGLPDALLATPEMRELAAGVLVSAREELVGSDAIKILSDLLDVSTDRFGAYIDQLQADTLHADVTTFCNMAAILAEGGYLPAEGEVFDDALLEDAQLKARIRAEMDKNAALAQFFAPETSD